MKASKLKNLVGIYSASLSLMGLIVPVSVLGSIAQAFPGTPIATIQLMVTLPSLIAIPTGILVSKLASRITKRSLILFFTAFYILAGTMPIYLHASMTELLLSAALVGVALGGLQNPMTAIITDVFEGEERFRYMNMLPTFICGGGTIYTMVAAMLGATDWTHAFYAYLIIGVFLVLEVFCTPKTVLEPKATKTEKAKVPREVYFLCAFGFLLYTACQVFNNNEAMLVAERGLGGVVEAGFGSTANTVAGIVSGFIATPLMRKLDKKYPVVLIGTGLVGLLCFALTSSVPMLCFAGFVIGLSYQLFTGVVVVGASNNSAAMGISFNIALGNAASSLGQSLAPFTTSALAAPFGGSITAIIWVGVAIAAAIFAWGLVHFRAGTWLTGADKPAE